jgi:mxaJ protein
MVWGPFAGSFAQNRTTALAVVPVIAKGDPSAQPFVYAMAMGVRHGDTALKARLDEVLARRHDDIVRVLQSYGVPLVSDMPIALAP